MVLAMVGVGNATITIPNVFTPFTTISSSQVNANFSAVATNALDKRGDSMTGTLNTQVLLPDITNSRNLGSASFQYLNAWISGTLTTGAVAMTGALSGATTGAFSSNVTVGGTLGVTGSTTMAGVTAGAISGTSLTLSTPLPIASGGTNGTATPTAGAVAEGNGSALAYTAAGTTGQVLQSNGSGTPIWFGNTASFAAGNTGVAITLNFVTNGLVQQVTRNASTTITLTHPSLATSVVVVMVHDGTSTAYTVAFSPTVKWPSGVAPTFTATAGGVDVLTLFWDGANWYGVLQVAFA